MDDGKLPGLGGWPFHHADFDSSSLALLPLETPGPGLFSNVTSPDANSFNPAISLMPQNVPENVSEHRALSETFSLPAGIGVVGHGCSQLLLDETDESWQSIYLDTEKFLMSPKNYGSDMMGPAVPMSVSFPPFMNENLISESRKKPMVEHQQSQSSNGSTLAKRLELVPSSSAQPCQIKSKNGMPDDIESLSNVDPKRAKRIWANRQSAARSKQKKLQYISELEQKVETLMAEKINLSAQLTLAQKENSAQSCEINELKLRLQTLDEYVRLKGASRDVVQEMEHLTEAMGQETYNGRQIINCGPLRAANQ